MAPGVAAKLFNRMVIMTVLRLYALWQSTLNEIFFNMKGICEFFFYSKTIIICIKNYLCVYY